MSKEGNIDDIFKGKLSDMEVTPSDAVWKGIESELNNKPRRKKYWLFALMILLISSVAIGSYFYKKPTDRLVSQVETENTESNLETAKLKNNSNTDVSSNNAISESGNTLSPSKNASTTKTTAKADNNASQIKQEIKQVISEQTAEQQATTQQTAQEKVPSVRIEHSSTSSNHADTEGSSQKMIAKSSSSAGISQIVSSNNSQKHLDNSQNFRDKKSSVLAKEASLNFQPKFIPTLSAEFSPISPLIRQSEQAKTNKAPKRQWMVGLYGGMNWNLKHLNYDSNAQLMVVDSVLSRELNTTTFAYGALVSMKWKKNWRISTGISYSKWCRKAVYPLAIPIDPNTLVGNPTLDYTKELGGPTGGQNINVPGNELSEYENLSPIPSTLDFDLMVEECYEIVSIPMRLGYEAFFNEFSLVPEIGIGYNRVIGRRITADASNDLDSIEFDRDESFKKDMFSVSGSLGIERYLSPQFKIGVNGVYQYNISPLYKSNQFNTHPYTISGQVRLWYIFSK